MATTNEKLSLAFTDNNEASDEYLASFFNIQAPHDMTDKDQVEEYLNDSLTSYFEENATRFTDEHEVFYVLNDLYLEDIGPSWFVERHVGKNTNDIGADSIIRYFSESHDGAANALVAFGMTGSVLNRLYSTDIVDDTHTDDCSVWIERFFYANTSTTIPAGCFASNDDMAALTFDNGAAAQHYIDEQVGNGEYCLGHGEYARPCYYIIAQ